MTLSEMSEDQLAAITICGLTDHKFGWSEPHKLMIDGQTTFESILYCYNCHRTAFHHNGVYLYLPDLTPVNAFSFGKTDHLTVAAKL